MAAPDPVPPRPAGWRGIVDRAVELPVVTSFTRFGYEVRSRTGEWDDLDDYDLTGRTIVVTGASSGLGRSIAVAAARLGATVVVGGRDEHRAADVRDELVQVSGHDRHTVAIADLADLAAVRRLAASLLAGHASIDVLIHNAGALAADRQVSPDGIEATVASQVVGPFLLTGLLLPALRASSPGRVITMSSGGMYATGLTVGQLEMSDADYRGAEQYARAKRAQVTLKQLWAERVDRHDVVFHALHPGWAETPGVEASLPTFRRVVGPLLRTPAQGADTAVWLAASDVAATSSGWFWLDRTPRSLHKLPTTRRTDTPERREELWDWCVERAGFDPLAET